MQWRGDGNYNSYSGRWVEYVTVAAVSGWHAEQVRTSLGIASASELRGPNPGAGFTIGWHPHATQVTGKPVCPARNDTAFVSSPSTH